MYKNNTMMELKRREKHFQQLACWSDSAKQSAKVNLGLFFTHTHACINTAVPLYGSQSPVFQLSSPPVFSGGGGCVRWIHNTATLCCNQYVGGLVIKLHPFPPPCGRSRLMFLVTRRDDEVSYYPTSRTFKITMNILRNSLDSATVFFFCSSWPSCVNCFLFLLSFFLSSLTWRCARSPLHTFGCGISHAVCPWGQVEWPSQRRNGVMCVSARTPVHMLKFSLWVCIVCLLFSVLHRKASTLKGEQGSQKECWENSFFPNRTHLTQKANWSWRPPPLAVRC